MRGRADLQVVSAVRATVGTGYTSLPAATGFAIASSNLRVHGQMPTPAVGRSGSLSRRPASRLRPKPGSEPVGVTIGDFATTTVEERSRWRKSSRTRLNLTTQDELVGCFLDVPRNFSQKRCFVVEAVPRLQFGSPGRTRP
jgi:hypothetical protein